jgi:cell division protein FtsL
MSIELEYAVKKDIRNRGIVRQTDARQRAELQLMFVLTAAIVAMLLFSSWQQYAMFESGVRIEQLRTSLEAEQEMHRQLRLNIATLRAPQELARRAAALGLRPATLAETLVVERLPESIPAGSIVAAR